MALIGSNILIQTCLIFQLGLRFNCIEEGERQSERRGEEVEEERSSYYKHTTAFRGTIQNFHKH